ncbi:hypothetical protein HN709_05325, partial [Candidatus Peregrinibacteria bacterium]|nr:hypothetical protein [Candidatus Peregrinibacteria bacterium]
EEEEEEGEEQPPGELKITGAKAWPKGFNPTLVLTKISFTTTAASLITLEIRSDTGQEIVTIYKDEEAKAGSYEEYWDGTDNPDEDKGKIVPQGAYTWKIIAKDPATKKIKDSETGEVTVMYNPGGTDFESSGTGSSGNSSSSNTTTATSNSGTQSALDTQNTLAMLSLQSATEGETAGTGPEMLVYLFLPAAGLYFRRKR